MTALLAPGDVVLGRYRVERVLGKGGMGMVVAARHIALGELFAIKLMLVPEGVPSDQAIDRFLREARICASLKGEHVVKVQDVGQLDGGQPYMVLEYLEGQDLDSVLESRRAIRVTDVAKLMLQACEALSEAHAQGIVHRDIKPANMFLIRKPNGEPSLKLLDFGISKRINSETKSLTVTGSMMGSPLYMSPEQLADPKSVGPQSDIWAMGVLFYELVTGQLPFDGEVIGQLVQSILNGNPAPPSTHRLGLSLEVDRIVARCLQKDPRDRYVTVEDLATDIRALAEASDVQAMDASLPALTVEIKAPGKRAEDIALDATVATNPEQASGSAPGSRSAGAGISGNTHASVSTNVSPRGSSRKTFVTVLGIGVPVLAVIWGLAVYTMQGVSPPKDPTTAPENDKPTQAAQQPAPSVNNGPIEPPTAATTSTTPASTTKPIPGNTATTKSTSAVAAPTATIKGPPVPTTTTTTKKKREGLF